MNDPEKGYGRRRVEPPRTPMSRDLEPGSRKQLAPRPPEVRTAPIDRDLDGRPPGAKAQALATESSSGVSRSWVVSRRKSAILVSLLLLAIGLVLVIQRGGSNPGMLSVSDSVSPDSRAPGVSTSAFGSPTTSQSPESKQPEAADWSSIAKSVVFVDASEDPACSKVGSGSIVGDGSFILTNEHVVMYEDGSTSCPLSIWLAKNENEEPTIGYRAEVVIVNRELDLAILRVLDEYGLPTIVAEAPPLQFATEKPTLGQEITVLGYPSVGGIRITLSSGRFAGLSDDTPPYYKTDAMLNPGNSGGGAFNSRRELVGVPTLVKLSDKSDPFETALGLLRPITDAIPLLEEARSVILESQMQLEDSNTGSIEVGNGTDPRFATCREAKSEGYGPYWYGIDEEYDWYMDRDSDGVVCE